MAATLEQALLYTCLPKNWGLLVARAHDTLLCGWARRLCAYRPGTGNICLLRVSAVNLSRTCPVLFSSNDCYTTSGVTMTAGCQKPAIASLYAREKCVGEDL